MSLPHGAKAEDEATAPVRRTGLIGVGDDTRIEQRRGFEGIFVQKISADQLALDFAETRMRRKRVFHFVGARLEGRQKVAVAALEVLKDVGQLVRRHLGVERHDALDDMVCPGLVSRVEVARFDRRLERAHNHSRRIGPQMKCLTVQERDL